MKTVGIIGGMSYQSTLHYYERINEQVNNVLGGLNSAKLIIFNVNFEEIRKLMLDENWEEIGRILLEIARRLEVFGADYIVIATNTIHKVADYIERNISVPLIHISDCVAKKCIDSNITRVGLIGTKYTMTQSFVIDRLQSNGLNVYVPNDKKDITYIDAVIFDELCNGIIKKDSKKGYIEIINKMIEEDNIEGIIFGCTEIDMLINPDDLTIPVFDTTTEHINSIVKYLVKEQ